MAARKETLQQALAWHQFNFDVDNELQWIKERLHAVISTNYGKNLLEAQNLHTKHQVCFSEVFNTLLINYLPHVALNVRWSAQNTKT